LQFAFLSLFEKVARYSALVGGIGYGIFHQRTLQKREDVRASIAEKKYQEKLLEDKRREQDQKILAAVHSGGSGGEWHLKKSLLDTNAILIDKAISLQL